MAVVIRLARGGAKKRPYYRIVAADQRMARDGRYIEKLGTYNPMLPKDDATRLNILADRVKHWLSVGAQPSDRVHSLLFKAGLVDKPADVSHRPTLVRKNKDKKTRAELRAEAAAEAAAKPAEEAAPAVEAPAAEAPAEAVAEAPASEESAA